MFQPDILATIAIYVALNKSLAAADGIKFTRLAQEVGHACQLELQQAQEASRNLERYWLQLQETLPVQKNDLFLPRMEEYFRHVDKWDNRMCIKVGSVLIDAVMSNCKFKSSKDGGLYPAFLHTHLVSGCVTI